MRTTDFSLAPHQARADVVVVVERAAADRAWRREVRRAARRAAGHRWDRTYRLPGGAHGLLVWFATADDADAFVATRPDGERHRALRAEPEGYTNGVWRAEGDVMAHVERFTPVTRETERGTVPPRVADPAADRRPGARRWSPGRAPAAAARRSPVDAQALFVGATRYRGPHSWALLSREWYPMVAAMRRLPGYVWHGVYWEPPFTLGTIAFFATRDDLLVFARVPAHRRLMRWVTQGRRHGTGGWIRLHRAERQDETPDEARDRARGTTP